MLLKTITASNITEAMHLIRKAFGDEAIIVSSITDEVTGSVKVTAALDQQFSSANNNQQHTKAMATESMAKFITPIDIVGEAFDQHSVPRRLGDKLLEAVEALEVDDAMMGLAGIFDSRYTFSPLNVEDISRPYMLIGPPGVGKTLLTAKIATQARLKEIPVRAFTLDTIKAGGFEQLKSYMDALDMPLEAASSTGELDQKLNLANFDELKLIDTTGVNPYDKGELADLKTYVQVARAEPILVISAGYDTSEAGDIAENFKETFQAQRFIFTRLDLTKRYGSALVIAEKAKIAFSHASLSPLVAEGFTALTPVGLARLFLEGNRGV